MALRNLIFDLGNVIINIDPEETSQRLMNDFNIDYDFFKEKMSQVFLDYEVGKIDEHAFATALGKEANKPMSKDDILEHWNSMLIDIPEERLEMLDELSRRFKVFILSNTNYTHISWVKNYLKKHFGKEEFEDWGVSKAYYSHELGERKPDKACFSKLIHLEGIKPIESLFIDDLPSNVQAGKTFGMKSILHDPKSEIQYCIVDYINEFSR
jgi:putative hydrolase of the HAD superfamily